MILFNSFSKNNLRLTGKIYPHLPTSNSFNSNIPLIDFQIQLQKNAHQFLLQVVGQMTEFSSPFLKNILSKLVETAGRIANPHFDSIIRETRAMIINND